jgi:undecaprenyl pyrophosphate phosphatase UppP
MLIGFGVYAGAVGLVLTMWLFHVGFLVKKILKEQRETNRLLQQLSIVCFKALAAPGGSRSAAASNSEGA